MTYTYKQSHIPKSTPNYRRPAYSMNPTTITIHNTGNPASTAQNERGWLTNSSNHRTASYHIVIDQKEAIECIPLNESAWHSGDGSSIKSGNRTSIGIELCESGDYEKTVENAVELVAKMLKERNWGVDRLRRHFDWSGKICPRLMYDSDAWSTWYEFKNRVQAKLQEDEPMTKEEKQAFDELKAVVESQAMLISQLQDKAKMKELPTWAKDAVDAALKAKLIDTPEGGSYDFYRILTILERKDVI
ncbi:N-acetylmuramoyl-L-alanine amidase [Paenibacillus sp. J5C_2022]|uniref:peptidoglycan recognition protein family protein n=1 Tax=Paenibacillus sp. J5C2022 TaxID=2977129 RepID=UPI0021D35C53|nr:N-acetylmuramoyl-L-alanine amidase [Paenibacillus sp. J5C2022]MCU6709386.1 N-acetylmuramoyl-L-alanine amidase [Paenibacillus sp. J5C2022]